MHNITSLDYKLLEEKYKNADDLNEVVRKIEEDNYPVQYAIGNVEFVNVHINVDKRVLIPRFATELLVSKTFDYIYKLGLENAKILDVCTGSGAIAISLKKRFPNATVYAFDISRDALEVAALNAKLNDVNVNFFEDDVLSDKNNLIEADILISNPPYVREDEYVSANTKYEPQGALFPGRDDIIFYKTILSKSKRWNYKIIAFEIGSLQGERVGKIAKKYYPNAQVSVQKDFEGFDRFIFIINE